MVRGFPGPLPHFGQGYSNAWFSRQARKDLKDQGQQGTIVSLIFSMRLDLPAQGMEGVRSLPRP